MPPDDLPDQESPETQEPNSTDSNQPLGVVQRFAAWAKANRMRFAAMTAAVFCIFLLLAGAISLSLRNAGEDNQLTIKEVLDALDRGDLHETRTLAKRLRKEGTLRIEEFGGPIFALGAATAYEAEKTDGKNRGRLFLLAAKYLEDANIRGFPAGRQDEGLYLLGKSLYESGQLSAARSVLISAIKKPTPYASKIHALLANVYCDQTPPKLKEALAENTLFLADKQLSEAQREEGLMQRLQIYLAWRKIEHCRKVLDQIPKSAKTQGKCALWHARILMAEAAALKKQASHAESNRKKENEKLQQAIELLKPLQTKKYAGTATSRQGMYLTAMCSLQLAEYQSAAVQFSRTYKANPDSPEGAAAAFQAAQLYIRLNRDVEVPGEFRRALADVSGPQGYHNPWISFKQLQVRSLAAYRHYLDVRNFEITLQLIRIFKPLFPKDQLLLLQAETHFVWGQTLAKQAQNSPLHKAASFRKLAREQYRQAGVCYARLARILPDSKTYTDQVWNSAVAFMKGWDFTNAVRMFQTYLKNEVLGQRPLALTDLGESFLALDKLDKALETFKE
ncbi:MAG: hypothetical protein ACWGMZ_10280, partial [Thermoguttaceae bacterium]